MSDPSDPKKLAAENVATRKLGEMRAMDPCKGLHALKTDFQKKYTAQQCDALALLNFQINAVQPRRQGGFAERNGNGLAVLPTGDPIALVMEAEGCAGHRHVLPKRLVLTGDDGPVLLV